MPRQVFAKANYPLEGLFSKEEGTPATLDELQAPLYRLNKIEGRQALGANFSEPLTPQVRNVIDYTSENCPVERVALFHDSKVRFGEKHYDLRKS